MRKTDIIAPPPSPGLHQHCDNLTWLPHMSTLNLHNMWQIWEFWSSKDIYYAGLLAIVVQQKHSILLPLNLWRIERLPRLFCSVFHCEYIISRVEFHECLPDFLPVLCPQVDVSCASHQVPTPVTFNIHESLLLSSSSSSSSLSSSAAATAAKVNSTMHGKNQLKLQWSKASIHNSRSLHFDSMATVGNFWQKLNITHRLSVRGTLHGAVCLLSMFINFDPCRNLENNGNVAQENSGVSSTTGERLELVGICFKIQKIVTQWLTEWTVNVAMIKTGFSLYLTKSFVKSFVKSHQKLVV